MQNIRLKSECTNYTIFPDCFVFSPSVGRFINFSGHLSCHSGTNKATVAPIQSSFIRISICCVYYHYRTNFPRLTRNYPSRPRSLPFIPLRPSSLHRSNRIIITLRPVLRFEGRRWWRRRRGVVWRLEWEFQSRARWRISDTRGASNFPRRQIQFPGRYSHWILFTWRYENPRGHLVGAVNEAVGEHSSRHVRVDSLSLSLSLCFKIHGSDMYIILSLHNIFNKKY